jgi:hypothetical protein
MERTTIDLTFPNLVTVTLLAAVGYFIFAFGSQFVLRYLGGGPVTMDNQAGY